MRAWQREAPEASRPFREAGCDVEFQTDGTCVDTTGGWREVRLSIFARRHRDRPVVDFDAWDDQRLPSPRARVATAVIRTSDALGPQRRRAARLEVQHTPDITVLAHGAEWIWAEVQKNLPVAAEVQDIFHASEHLEGAEMPAYGWPGGRVLPPAYR